MHVDSFLSQTKPIEHETAGAKEPPLPSLPFSFGKSSIAEGPAPETGTETQKSEAVSAFKPLTSGEANKVQETSAKGEPSKVPVDVITQKPTASSNFFTTPAASTTDSSAASKENKPPSLPSFVVASPLLSQKEATPSAGAAAQPFSFGQPVSGAAPSIQGDTTPKESASTTLPVSDSATEKSASKSFSLGVKSQESGGTLNTAPFSLFGQPSKPAEAAPANAVPLFQSPASSGPSNASSASTHAPSTLFGSSTQASKSTDPTSRPTSSGQTPLFNFSGTSVAPKPLFGLGGPSGGGSGSTTASNISGAHSTTSTLENKSPFTFGAPAPVTPTKPAATSNSHASETLSAPKPLFGGPSSGNSMFAFGNSAASSNSTAPAAPAPAIEPPKSTPSPFQFGAPPATPPAGPERTSSPFTFGAPPPSSSGSMFTFGAASKPANAPAPSAPIPATTSSPFTFGPPPQRPITPPSKPDDGMNMEESPTRMDDGNKPNGTISFGTGPTPTNPFGQPLSSTSAASPFTFGTPTSHNAPAANPFAPKVETHFNRTSSAPAPTISTTFSFGAKNDQPTPPATAFGSSSNPFGQPPPSSGNVSSPFTFGQQSSTTNSNPFGGSTQPAVPSAAPASPFGQSNTSFSFGAPANTANTPFSFGSSPSSPATGPSGLPQSPASTGAAFAFGQSSGSAGGGGAMFNIGAPPSSTGPGGTPTRQVKKLPNRARPPPRR